MVPDIVGAEIVEDGKAVRTRPAHFAIIHDVGLPSVREAQGKEHLGQVLHMLLADLKLCREIIIFFVTALVVPDVIAGQAANAHPMRLSLPFRAEGRTYAHPVFRHRVSDTDNIAKTVVRTACEGGIGVPLLCATVDDFGQVRNGRNLHLNLCPGCAAGFGISKRADLRVIPGITWGILVNGVHTHQVGKTPGRSCRSVGGHNACLGVGRIRHAYHRLKGLSLVVRSNV